MKGACSAPVFLCQCLVCMLSVSNLSSASIPVLATSFPINSNAITSGKHKSLMTVSAADCTRAAPIADDGSSEQEDMEVC